MTKEKNQKRLLPAEFQRAFTVVNNEDHLFGFRRILRKLIQNSVTGPNDVVPSRRCGKFCNTFSMLQTKQISTGARVYSSECYMPASGLRFLMFVSVKEVSERKCVRVFVLNPDMQK